MNANDGSTAVNWTASTEEEKRLRAELARVTAEFVEIIERIDHRCSAIDGPIPPTLQEATTEELRRLWNLAHEIKAITGGET